MPERTCIGCRVCCAQDDLLRLQLSVSSEGERARHFEPSVGRRARTGRGAYVCPRRSCFDQAIKRRAFTRAFSSSRSGHGAAQPGIETLDPAAADALWSSAVEQVRREIQLLDRSAEPGPEKPHTQSRLVARRRGLERLLFELSSAPIPPVRPTPHDRRQRSNGQGGSPTHG
jgi:predicted RNA-binding protein YlxR (DUF448 family)